MHSRGGGEEDGVYHQSEQWTRPIETSEPHALNWYCEAQLVRLNGVLRPDRTDRTLNGSRSSQGRHRPFVTPAVRTPVHPHTAAQPGPATDLPQDGPLADPFWRVKKRTSPRTKRRGLPASPSALPGRSPQPGAPPPQSAAGARPEPVAATRAGQGPRRQRPRTRRQQRRAWNGTRAHASMQSLPVCEGSPQQPGVGKTLEP